MYSLGVRTSNVTAANACFELIAPPLTGIDLMEMEISAVTAVATNVPALGRPAAAGLVPTTPAALISEDSPTRTTLTTTAVAWGTGPTVPVAFFKRANLGGSIGQYINWKWEEGLFIPAGATLIVWNTGTASLMDINVRVLER